jgi:hypothetical protein
VRIWVWYKGFAKLDLSLKFGVFEDLPEIYFGPDFRNDRWK